MKKYAKYFLVVMMFLAPALFAQTTPSTKSTESKTASTNTATSTSGTMKMPMKAMTYRGTISEDGKSFVIDTNKETLNIMNPDIIKGHEGHHVSVKGEVNKDKSEIQISSVKMLTQAKAKKASKAKTVS